MHIGYDLNSVFIWEENTSTNTQMKCAASWSMLRQRPDNLLEEMAFKKCCVRERAGQGEPWERFESSMGLWSYEIYCWIVVLQNSAFFKE